MKYSHFTLRPNDDEEQKLFFEFRLKDVQEQYKVYCYLLAFVSAVQVVKCLLSPDIISVVDTAYVVLISVLLILFYKLGQRLQRKHLQIGLSVIFGVGAMMLVLGFVLLIAPSGASETEKKISLE